MIRIWFGLLFVLFAGNLYGQSKNLSFDHLTVEDGLSQSTAFVIAQDHQGFIWIGTRDGLNRYNSHDFRIYRHHKSDSTSISNNTVSALLVDSNGTMWIGTSNGLCIYHPETDNFSTVSGLSSNVINVIYEDSLKNIWVGTRHGLNLLVSLNPYRFKSFYHDPRNPSSLIDNDIRTVFRDHSGEYWVGTMNGVSRFKYQSGRKISCIHYTSALSDKWINAVIEGKDQNIWVGTEKGGLNIYDRAKDVFYSVRNLSPDPAQQRLIRGVNQSVRVIQTDKKGMFWIGTIAGLYVYNPADKSLREFLSNSDNPASLSDNSVRSIYIDKNDSKWIGTYYGGVNFYNPMVNQFDHFKQTGKNSPLRFKIASAMYEDKQNNMWLSTDGVGIIFWNRKNNTFETLRHSDEPSSLSHGNIKCIYPDGNEGLWIGTINGLNYLSFGSRKFRRYYADNNPYSLSNDRIYDIKADKQGNFWIATLGGGLCMYDKKTRRFEAFHYRDKDPNSLNSDFLTCLYFDSKNRLWIGTMTGLSLKSPEGRITRIPGFQEPNDSPNGKFILFIYEDHLKRIWFGTREYGLFQLKDEKGNYKQYTTENGLPGNNVFGMLEDDHGIFWLSTENGLSRFDPRTGKFKNYGRNDGLICKEFNYNSYLKDHTGRMYFGGYNGIVTFHPDSILENKFIPSVVFTKLKLFNSEVNAGDKNNILKKPVNETKVLKFRYDQNVFTIEFAVLNFINPSKNRYAYKLEGFEKKWTYTGIPSATYMNLKPGTYKFLVKGSNNDDEWNETPISLTIKVLPPPWKTWWAFLLYSLIIVSGFMYIMRMIRVRLKLEQNLYLEQIENKKQNELNQAKLRFFTNISHELRTPLTLIISPIENLANTTSDLNVRKQLQMIQSNAHRLLRLLNQLLDFRKQETKNLKLKVAEGNIVKFIREIELAFQEYARLKKISLSFTSDLDEIKLWYDREELEKVFFNLLSNALKFTHEGGEIKIKVQGNTSGYIDITVEDNGIGIPREHLEKVFNSFYQVENREIINHGFGIGLALSKAIVELHHGKISIDSLESIPGVQGGTKFIVSLKTGKSHFTPDEIVPDFKNSEQLDSYLSLELETIPETELKKEPSHGKQDYLVLIVEDNQEIRSYIRSHLEQSYNVKEAENGKEAWEIASNTLPDVIVSDVMMPVMDGIALTSKLKSDERTSHIPVILVTARNAIVHQMEGLETGADEYITKPFNINLLRLKIRNLLDTREKLKQKYSHIVSLEPKYEELSNPDDKFMQKLLGIIDNQLPEPEFNVSRLVTEIGMSRPVLFRKIKALTGMSVIDLIKTTRLKKAAMLLKQKKMSIAEVGYAVGFSDAKYFSKAFRQQFGKSPSEFISAVVD